MSTAKSVSKKRKRESASSDGVVLKLAPSVASSIGPLLVSYPAVQAPPSTAFKCYANKKTKKDGKQTEKRQGTDGEEILVVGETEDVEFISNADESQRVAQSGCQYLIAVHNRRTSTLNILPTPKIPYILTRTVKALKTTPSSEPTQQQEYKQARTTLGQVFGTKKAKANIRAQERNRVDVKAMEGVMDHLQYGIDKGAAGLMTTEEAKEEADKNRLIPPFNATTTDPEDVYPLHSIIPDVEWKALTISAFDQATGPGERQALLPHKWSTWVNYHINAKHEDSDSAKKRKKNLKIVIYISTMLAFRRIVDGKEGINKDELCEKMAGVPAVVVDGLLSRFAETSRGSTNYVSTSTTQTKLLTYIFALCLKVDSFASNTTQIAVDLRKPVSIINSLFKSLGCKISVLGERERARLGIPDSQATIKRAVLDAPVSFPKPRMKRK